MSTLTNLCDLIPKKWIRYRYTNELGKYDDENKIDIVFNSNFDLIRKYTLNKDSKMFQRIINLDYEKEKIINVSLQSICPHRSDDWSYWIV